VLTLASNTAAGEFKDLLLDSRDFIENEAASCPLDMAARKRLRDEFKMPWPCLRVILRLAQRQSPGNPGDLRQIIQETSGLGRLRREIQDRFFARARVLKRSKLLATAWEPCDRAQHVLRNYKLDINRDLERADRAKVVLAERVASGDAALLSAQEFVQSAAGKLAQDMNHVSENLRRVGEIVLRVKDAHEQMEQDVSMLDLLDQTVTGLAPQTLEMLRCLFGRGGADDSARLSFFAGRGKAAVLPSDLDEAIGDLRQIRPQVPGKLRAAVDHAVDHLEQIANRMEGKPIPQIALAHETPDHS
jgi:hypothetical protein